MTLGLLSLLASVSLAADVVVPTKPVSIGMPLTADMLTIAVVPDDSPLPRDFATVESLLGRAPKTPLYPGEPVLEARLLPAGQTAALDELAPDGTRIIAVPLPTRSELHQPGTRVDVLHTGPNKTCTWMIDILVVATRDGDFERRTQLHAPADTVFVASPASQADNLAAAAAAGEISLTVRGQGDHETPYAHPCRDEYE